MINPIHLTKQINYNFLIAYFYTLQMILVNTIAFDKVLLHETTL